MQDTKSRLKFFYIIRWAIKCFIGLFIFLLILEVTLQSASLIENKKLNKQLLTEKIKSRNINRFKGNKQTRIVCVGDSFTQGVGASSREHSYPMQLQAYLKEKSSFSWEVFNCGVAGNGSSQLLSSLPGLLKDYSPGYVFVLIGVNDFFNTDLIKEEVSYKIFFIRNDNTEFIPWRLRFRTYRLFKLLLKHIKDVRTAKNNLSGRRNNNLSSRKAIAESSITQELLGINGSMLSEEGAKEKSRLSIKVVSGGQNYLNEQMRLLRYLIAQRMFDDADKQARLIRGEIFHIPTRLHIILARIFIELQQLQYAYDEIAQFKKFYPNDEQINEVLGILNFREYKFDTAEAYFIKAINMQPKKTLPYPYRLLAKIYIVRDHNLEESLRLIVKAYLIDRNIESTAIFLSDAKRAHPLTMDYFEKMINKSKLELNIDASAYKRLSGLIKIIGDEAGARSRLSQNLLKISALCSRYKAIPIFLTYPYPYSNSLKATLIIKDFCLQRSGLMIDVSGYFENLIKSDKFEKYFIPDSHLNDTGYRVFAEKIGIEILNKIFSPIK